jgi:hypothetical protein
MKKVKLFEEFINEGFVNKTAKNILNALDKNGQLFPDYIQKEALTVIEDALKKSKGENIAKQIRLNLEDIGILANMLSPTDVESLIMNNLHESIVNEAKELSREDLMDLLEMKYKIKTVRESEDFNGQTEGIWLAADNEEELSGNKIFDYYNRSAKYTNGVLKQFRTAIEKTGWWFEWNDPGTIMIWPKNE